MTDPRNFLFNSNYEIDKIIGIVEGTTTINAPINISGPTSIIIKQPHGFDDSCYFAGIFSSDNSTYNDFGSQTPNLKSPSEPVFQTLDCNATVDKVNINITVTNYYDFVNSVGTSYPNVNYKVALIAKNTMTVPITPLPVNEKVAFSTEFNYLKIFNKDSTTLNVASGDVGSTVIFHGLGYIPRVKAFFFDNATPDVCRPINYTPSLVSGSGIDSPQVQIDEQKVTFFSDQSNFDSLGINGSIEYRIYYDS